MTVIAALRKAYGISQAQLAQGAGITAVQISRMEAEKCSASRARLEDMAEYFRTLGAAVYWWQLVVVKKED